MEMIPQKLYRLTNLMQAEADHLLRGEFGFSFHNYLLLQFTGNSGIVSQSEIAQHMGVTNAAVSRMVIKLKASKLIMIAVDSKNRRKNNVKLSDSGKKLLLKINAFLEKEFVADVGRSLNKKQLSQLITWLDLMASDISAKRNSKLP